MAQKRIIVVENQAEIALNIKTELTKFGHDVPAIVASGEEAVLAALRLKPDLILMALTQEEEIRGLEVAILINKVLTIPVIFLMAHADNKIDKLEQKNGTYSFLHGPYNAQDLMSTIENASQRLEDMDEIRRLNQDLQLLIEKIEKLRIPLPICL